MAATYDGDTSPEARTWVRRNANVVLTNPEMLHGALLPFHGRWANFLGRLRYVVVDELHTLRGIFGSHTAHLLRRLRRVCAGYGSDPTFVFSSATIGDPARLASELCGLPVHPVVDDASPRGERLFALWNPPLLDADTGARASTNVEVARLAAAFVEGGWRTVAFCRSRRATEVVASDVRRRVGPEYADAIRSYRAGYLASERREIEAELFSGRLRGVVATNALELGIDVGGLDACILNGFPGTIASMWQQAGRAGRDERPSVAVLVAGTDQLDQWLMAHPREVFTRPPEPAVVNRSNPSVLLPQLACAAYERPLTPDDEPWWGDDLADGVRQLVLGDRLRLRNGAAYWQGRGTPAPGIGLRSGSPDEFRIAEADGRLVGTVDGSRAFEQVHPGAIYLHLGQQYRVVTLDLDDRVALVEPVVVDEYTQVRSQMQVSILGADDLREVGRSELFLGPVEIATEVVGYERHDSRTRRLIGREELTLPPARLVTRAFWYTIDDEVLDRARLGARAGARRPARRRARRHRHPAAVHDLRPLGRRRGVDAVPGRHRPADDRDLRRLPRRRGHRRAGVRRRPAPPGGDAGGDRALPVRPGVPELRAVAEVRQRERAPRQGRRGGAAAGDPRPAVSAGRRCARRAGIGGRGGGSRPVAGHGWRPAGGHGSLRIVAVPVTVTSPISAPTSGTSVGAV